MFGNKVFELLESRKREADRLKAEIERWQKDERFAEAHKSEQIAKLKDEFATMDADFRQRITTEIEKGRNEAHRRYHEEPEGDLSEEVRKLRLTMTNRDLTDDLLRRHGADVLSTSDLLKKATEAVNANLPTAEAYLRAVEIIEPKSEKVTELRKAFEEANRTDAQRNALTTLERLDKYETEHEQQSYRDRAELGMAGLADAVGMHYKAQGM